MKHLAIALLALCSTSAAFAGPSYLPFEDEKHPERYHLDIDTPPIACHTAHPHFKVYYFDEEGRMAAVYRVKLVRIDDMGVYFNKSDIIRVKKCHQKKR